MLAGFQWLQRETRDQRSPLFNFANVITLGPLDPPAARRLAEQPLAERLGVRYADPTLPDRVVERTGAYPSFVQLLCDQILRQLKGGELVITAAHIQQAEETEEVRNALRDRCSARTCRPSGAWWPSTCSTPTSSRCPTWTG